MPQHHQGRSRRAEVYDQGRFRKKPNPLRQDRHARKSKTLLRRVPCQNARPLNTALPRDINLTPYTATDSAIRVRNRFVTWEGRSRNLGAWVERIELRKVGMFSMC